MSARRDIEAGSAFVRLFLKDEMTQRLGRTVENAGRKMEKISRGLLSVGSAMLAAGTSIATPLALSVKAASDADETLNRFNALFADSADTVRAWADTHADAVGRSRSEMLDGLSSFQGFFKGMGFGNDEAAEMSKTLQALSIDFASFNNLTDAEAMQRFIAAMSGSGEVLDRFGINVKAAALDIKLLEMGFPTVSKGATEAQKALARYHIIFETMKTQGAVGDATKTAGSFANRLKALKGSVSNAAVSIGQALLPTVTKIADALVPVIQRIEKWVSSNPELFSQLAIAASVLIGAGGATVALGTALGVLGFAISAVGAALPVMIAAAKIGAVVIAGLVAATIQATAFFAVFGHQIKSTSSVLAAAFSRYMAIVTGLQRAIGLDHVIDELKGIASYLSGQFLSSIQDSIAIFRETFGVVGEALKSGDIKLAGEAAMAGLEAVFLRAKVSFVTIFEDIKIAILEAMHGAAIGLQDILGGMVKALSAVPGTAAIVDKMKGAIQDSQAATLRSAGVSRARRIQQAQQEQAAAMARMRGVSTTLDERDDAAVNAFLAQRRAQQSTRYDNAIDDAANEHVRKAQNNIATQKRDNALFETGRFLRALVDRGGAVLSGMKLTGKPVDPFKTQPTMATGPGFAPTFSAAAAITGLHGGTPQQRIEQLTRQHVDLAKKQLDADLKMVQELEKFNAGMVYG